MDKEMQVWQGVCLNNAAEGWSLVVGSGSPQKPYNKRLHLTAYRSVFER
jgi:hypothetical protein